MGKEKKERKQPQGEAVIFVLFRENPLGGMEVLVEERKKKTNGLVGYMIFPGGGVFEKESPQEAVKREVFEETGIEEVGSIIHLDTFEDMTLSGSHLLFHAYLVKDFKGEVYNKEPENCNLIWLQIDEANEQLRLASSRLVLNRVKEFITE